MSIKLNKIQLYALNEILGMTEVQKQTEIAGEIRNEVRKELGLSLPVEIDGSAENVTRRIAYYALRSLNMNGDKFSLRKDWLKFVAKRVREFIKENPNEIDETVVEALGSGNAKEFTEKYPNLKGYEKVYAAVQTWLNAKNGVKAPTELPLWTVRLFYVTVLIFMVILSILNGRFGKKKLIQPLRTIWCVATWGTVIYLFCKLILFPLFEWWDGAVLFLNHVIWG